MIEQLVDFDVFTNNGVGTFAQFNNYLYKTARYNRKRSPSLVLIKEKKVYPYKINDI